MQLGRTLLGLGSFLGLVGASLLWWSGTSVLGVMEVFVLRPGETAQSVRDLPMVVVGVMLLSLALAADGAGWAIRMQKQSLPPGSRNWLVIAALLLPAGSLIGAWGINGAISSLKVIALSETAVNSNEFSLAIAASGKSMHWGMAGLVLAQLSVVTAVLMSFRIGSMDEHETMAKPASILMCLSGVLAGLIGLITGLVLMRNAASLSSLLQSAVPIKPSQVVQQVNGIHVMALLFFLTLMLVGGLRLIAACLMPVARARTQN
jgi:hypothetical protein